MSQVPDGDDLENWDARRPNTAASSIPDDVAMLMAPPTKRPATAGDELLRTVDARTRRRACAEALDETVSRRQPWATILDAQQFQAGEEEDDDDDDALQPFTELATSIRRRDEAKAMAADILLEAAQGQFKVEDEATRLKMQRWGATRAWEFLDRVAASLLHAAYQRWRANASAATAAAKINAYRRFQGSRRLCWLWFDFLQRRLARAFVLWSGEVMDVICRETVAAQTKLALMLQGAYVRRADISPDESRRRRGSIRKDGSRRRRGRDVVSLLMATPRPRRGSIRKDGSRRRRGRDVVSP